MKTIDKTLHLGPRYWLSQDKKKNDEAYNFQPGATSLLQKQFVQGPVFPGYYKDGCLDRCY